MRMVFSGEYFLTLKKKTLTSGPHHIFLLVASLLVTILVLRVLPKGIRKMPVKILSSWHAEAASENFLNWINLCVPKKGSYDFKEDWCLITWKLDELTWFPKSTSNKTLILSLKKSLTDGPQEWHKCRGNFNQTTVNCKVLQRWKIFQDMLLIVIAT